MMGSLFIVLSESIVAAVARTAAAALGARTGATASVSSESAPSPCGGGC
jgi:hypothetical protein